MWDTNRSFLPRWSVTSRFRFTLRLEPHMTLYKDL